MVLGYQDHSTRKFYLGGKGGRCIGPTTLPPSCADCLKLWRPEPSGNVRACPGLSWDCFVLAFLQCIPVKHVLWRQLWAFQYFAVYAALAYQKTLKHSCVALRAVRSGKFFIAFQVCIYSASLVLSVFRAQGLQWDVPAHAAVLCDKAVLLFVAMKEQTVLYTHAGSCSVLWILT